jgi:hypothetical protein
MAFRIQGIPIFSDQTDYLDFTDTSAIKIPVGTELQRPEGVTGQLRYNTGSGTFEGFNGSLWGPMGGGDGNIDGGSASSVYTVNQTVDGGSA